MATNLHEHRAWVLAVVEQYELPLTRYATRLLRDNDAAHDVVQHAFLQLCDAAPDELRGRVAPWLFTVCRNKAFDVLRRCGAEQRLDEAEEYNVAARAADPALHAEADELNDLLRELVDELPTAQREVIELWSQGFSYREIAAVTGRKEGHVRLLNHRGLKRLRQHERVQHLIGEAPVEVRQHASLIAK